MNEKNKKDVIKGAARQLFFRFGLTKTSMEDIARQCRIAKPSLYYYYPSKEAIFNEVVIDEAEKFIHSVTKKIPEELEAADKIAFFYRTYYQDLKKYAHELAHIPETMYESYPHGRPIIKKISEILKEKLFPLLIQGKEDGSIQTDDLENTASAIILMTNFLNMDWILRNDESSLERTLENVLEIILNGIRRNNSHENRFN